MKISSKGKNSVAAVVYIAENSYKTKPITATAISNTLEISRSYLEQILSILKNSGILKSVKGSVGGFILAKPPEEISLYDILSKTELCLTEKNEPLYINENSEADRLLSHIVWDRLDDIVEGFLKSISVKEILEQYHTSALVGFLKS